MYRDQLPYHALTGEGSWALPGANKIVKQRFKRAVPLAGGPEFLKYATTCRDLTLTLLKSKYFGFCKMGVLKWPNKLSHCVKYLTSKPLYGLTVTHNKLWAKRHFELSSSCSEIRIRGLYGTLAFSRRDRKTTCVSKWKTQFRFYSPCLAGSDALLVFTYSRINYSNAPTLAT